MTRAETGRALLKAFSDAARLIQSGYDPRDLKSVKVSGSGRRSAAYQRGLLAAFASAYGS